MPEGPKRIAINQATETERDAIYRLRHDVYASELGQHAENHEHRLSDDLDAFNVYITAALKGQMAGFISITPPGNSGYSIDKYVSRKSLPFAFDDGLYEIRLLTVVEPFRGSQVAALLMYAALRWVEAHGGTRVVAIGRSELMDLYLKTGLKPIGIQIRSGAVKFEALATTIDTAREQIQVQESWLRKLDERVDWQLDIPLRVPAACFHGGASFDSIGNEFNTLERSRDVINADVLDAWYPPAPQVLASLQEYLPWLSRTAPPTDSQGMVSTIARVRGIPSECVLPGAGSSDLIFLAMREWLAASSRTLILDPTYGEYPHVLEQVVRCSVDRLALDRNDGYKLDLSLLESSFDIPYDLIILVNPNSPTGRHIPRNELEEVLGRAPTKTRIWVDETYVEYAGPDQSLERFASESGNVVVCKSMSKVYALSGLRAGYLSAPPHIIDELRSLMPPWAVSLPAQVAAVAALQDPEYYSGRYQQTHALRSELVDGLVALGKIETVPSVANFVLCHLDPGGSDATTVMDSCRAYDLYLRDVSTMSSRLGSHAFRIAVKDSDTNQRMLEILSAVLSSL